MSHLSAVFPKDNIADLDRKISQLEDHYVACFLRGEDKLKLRRIHLEIKLLKAVLEQVSSSR